MARTINHCDMCGELMLPTEVYDYDLGLRIVMECECGHIKTAWDYVIPVLEEHEC